MPETPGELDVARSFQGSRIQPTSVIQPGFAALKADSDVFSTFEGDNVVLLQLVAKGLL